VTLTREAFLLLLEGMAHRKYKEPDNVAASREVGSPWPRGFIPGPTFGEAFNQYHSEFRHRGKEFTYLIQHALTLFLKTNGLDEAFPLRTMDKERCLILKKALLDGTTTPKGRHKPGPVSISYTLDHLRRFTKWAVDNDLLDKDPMRGVVIPPRLVASVKIRKEGFTDEELRKIFQAMVPYRVHTLQARIEFYWSILLLAHTGCRAMEVIQLHKNNIFQEDGVWCIKITDEGERQKLKNRPSKRIVPLHSALVKVGFLNWVEVQPDGQLFPLLFPYGAQKASGWFTDVLKALRIKTPTKSLHSLRHTMTIKLERARVHYSLQRRMLGHAVGSDTEGRIYLGSLSYSAKELQAALELVQIPPVE
jgi:integrase